MIKHAWTAVCQKSIIDKDSNNISLDILEQLSIKTPPLPTEAKGFIFPFQIETISLWYRNLEEKGEKYTAQLKVQSSSGELLSTTKMEIDLTNSHRYRTRIRQNGLPIPKNTSGYYYFITELERNDSWVEVSRIPLEVVEG